MEITTFEHIQSKSLTNRGQSMESGESRLAQDENGGRINLVSAHETGCGISVSFETDTGQPRIAILDKDGGVGVTVMVNEEGGYIGIGGRDGKAKLLLCVEDGRGYVATGKELRNLSELQGSG